MKESLLLEWDYEKNGDVDPASVKDHSNKKFFWICPKGHPSYLMPVTKRSIGHGCPVCSNHKIIKGINDFETTNPELMQEWFWEENNKEGVDPSTFSSGSSRLAWWKCKKCGNTWRASVSNRTRIHSGCPYCANLKVKKGFNDLATLRPDLAKEWYQEKNGDLTPDEVVEGYPHLLNEWDYDKNKPLLPDYFSRGSNQKVWWRCKKGHSWQAQISNRCNGSGCPKCRIKPVIMLDPETLEEIKRYESTIPASKELGITSSNILAACKGQRNLAGGYKWKYAEV